MTYEEALQYIYERSSFRIKLGLERMHYLLEKLGDPHRRFPVVHIAGTNGKGSTTVMLSTVLKKAGYKVGRYTSPHLSSYSERIMVAEKSIPPESLAALVARVKPVVEAADGHPEIGPATFLSSGPCWLSLFAREEVDIAVVEVGMGETRRHQRGGPPGLCDHPDWPGTPGVPGGDPGGDCPGEGGYYQSRNGRW